MSYNNFPTIMAPTYDSDDEYSQRAIVTQFENGIEFARRTATVGKNSFVRSWNNMPEADYQTLLAFFKSQGTTPFNWTDSATGTSYVVRFPLGKLASKHVPVGRRKVTIELHEIPNA